MLILMNMWHQMIDDESSSSQLFQFMVQNIPHETDESILLKMLEKS